MFSINFRKFIEYWGETLKEESINKFDVIDKIYTFLEESDVYNSLTIKDHKYIGYLVAKYIGGYNFYR